jgi:hypothetical protein
MSDFEKFPKYDDQFFTLGFDSNENTNAWLSASGTMVMKFKYRQDQNPGISETEIL